MTKYFIIMPALAGLVLAATKLAELYRERQCPAEVVNEAHIFGTDWVAQTREQACGYGIGAMVDIRVVRSNGSGAAVLVTGENIDLAKLDGSASKRLHITLPFNLDTNVHPITIPGLTIDYSYADAPGG